jgi:frataxin-like iron-binding protein CyaY
MSGLNYFLRRIDSDVLNKKFIAALNKCSERYNSIKENYPQSLTWFKNFVTATLIMSVERMIELENEEGSRKIQDELMDYYADEIEERWDELQDFDIRESVLRVLKEETFRARIINMIEKDGLLQALKVTNMSYTKLFSLIGDEWLTRKVKQKFIKNVMDMLEYGFGLSEIGHEPIFYGENEDEIRQIDYLGKNMVAIDVLSKSTREEDGSFNITYSALDDRIIDEIFDVIVLVYENNKNFI